MDSARESHQASQPQHRKSKKTRKATVPLVKVSATIPFTPNKLGGEIGGGDEVEVLNNEGKQKKRRLEEKENWENVYQEFIDYQRIQQGKLGRWLKRQRSLYKEKKLSDSRRHRLAELGFNFEEPHMDENDEWFSKYKSLADYYNEHGHTNVPKNFKNNPGLASWVETQRKLKRNDELSDDQFYRLCELDFDFASWSGHWDRRFRELATFKHENGHCNVPLKYEANPALGVWVDNQRQLIKARTLSTERYQRLSELEFDFGDNEYVDLMENKKDGTSFEQKVDGKKTDKNSETHQRACDEIWERHFGELNEFKNDYGHCRVPRGYAKNPLLSSWVEKQRTLKRKKRLPLHRLERLAEVGFDFEVRSSRWEERFQQLIEFKDEHGHCNVPRSYKYNLGHWVANQRTNFRTDTITREHTDLLLKIGFDFGDQRARKRKENQAEKKEHVNNPDSNSFSSDSALPDTPLPQTQREDTTQTGHDVVTYHPSNLADCNADEKRAWDLHYQDLANFKHEHGHCDVPTGCGPNPALGEWVMDQRALRKSGKLLEERFWLLYDLDFDKDVDVRPESQRAQYGEFMQYRDDRRHHPSNP